MKRVLVAETNSRVKDIVGVGEEFPVSMPLHWEDAADNVQHTWTWNGSAVVAPVVGTEDLRADVIISIRDKMTELAGDEIPALGNMAMLELMAELWPHLTNPASNSSLDYIKDVVLKGRTLIVAARTANHATLEAFDVDNPPGGWPALP